ncbi:MAG: O-antigen ligase family protein [Planctomycetota bacterium]
MASVGFPTTPSTARQILFIWASNRSYEKVLLSLFFFCVYTRDWLYPAAFESMFILYLGYVGVIAAMIFPWGFLSICSFGWLCPRSKAVLHGILWATGAIALVVVCEQVSPSPFHETPRPFVVILFAASYLWMLMGFRMADHAERVQWLLSKTAFFLAILCVIAAFFRVTGMELTVFASFPGWQMRLVFLFPYTWYLTRWLLRRTDYDALVGLIASSLEVWGGLHKPIVFSAAISTLFIVWSVTRFKSSRAVAKVMGLVFATLGGTWAIDVAIANGSVSSQIRTFVVEKVFHEDRSSSLSMGWDDLFVQFTGGRLQLWELAVERFQASPWIGSGFEQNFPAFINNEDNDCQNVEIEVPCHNGYLDLMLSIGVLGFLPLAAVVFRGMSRMYNTSSNPAIKLIQIAAGGYLVAIAAFNLGGTSRVFIAGSLLPAFVLGIGLRLAAGSDATDSLPSCKPRFPSDCRVRHQ